MTKEELKQKAEEKASVYFNSLDIDNGNVSDTPFSAYDVFVAYEKGALEFAEPREKRIAELEHQLTHRNCLDCSNHSSKLRMRTLELEKENAELKDYRLTTLAKQQTDMSKYALNLEHKLSWYDVQLTKAKEIIKDLLSLCEGETDSKLVFTRAEQFISEVEK